MREDLPSDRPRAAWPLRLLGGPWALPAWLLALLVLRLPGLLVGLVNIDECDFWLFGRMVNEGARPYLDVADIKPPLTYLAYAAADLLSGHRFGVGVPALGLAAVLATALLLRAAALRWTGDPRAGWAAAWLALAAGLCESPAVNAELLMNAPVAAGLWALSRAHGEGRLRWWAWAGLLAGLATLVKLQAGILLLAFGASALLEARRPRVAQRRFPEGPPLLQALTALGSAYALPWAVAASAFAWAGTLPEAYDWVVRRNLFQIGGAQVFALSNVLPSIAVALLGASFAWWLALRGAGRPPGAFGRALVVLLALTTLPVSVGRRFYEHYFLQFVPPLALLGAPELVRLLAGWREQAPRLRRFALVLAAVPPLAYLGFTLARGLTGGYPGQEPRAKAIAAWLRAHTEPSERVFMWGDYTPVYCLANRLPGTRFMRTAPLVGDFDPLHLPDGFDFAPHRSERDIALALRDLEANRPALVVDTAAADLHRWSLFPLSRVPELAAYVQDHYRPVARPGGAVVYRLRGPTGVGPDRADAAPREGR